MIVVLLAVDIRANRGGWQPTVRRAVPATAAWVAVAVAFGAVLWVVQGRSTGEQYFAAYLLEKSLSIDNVFVFAVLFRVLDVPALYQRRVLYYGVVGALLLRAGFIAAGATLLDDLSWMFYVFGAFVLLVGVRMGLPGHEMRPGRNFAVRAARRYLPVTPEYEADRMLVRRGGRVLATPLLVALVAIEATDIVFAADSIPAVFGVTRDVFVVFTSNAFAVLGLRSLYFVFAGATERFRFIRFGLAAVMVFVGTKMLLQSVIHIPTTISLAVIALAISVAAVASLRADRQIPREGLEPLVPAGMPTGDTKLES